MKTYPLLRILLLVGGALAEISTQYKDHIMKKHNDYRKSMQASNMHILEWSDKLAGIADAWLSRCAFEHENKGYGENIAFDSAKELTDFTPLIDIAFESWTNESFDFNKHDNVPCGDISACHYTQLVWFSTREVGCAHRVCDSYSVEGESFKNIFTIGCWYSPKGNWVTKDKSGQRKMIPFNKGPAGSECQDGETVVDGFCTGIPTCKDIAQENCVMWKEMGQCKPGTWMEQNCRLTCDMCEEGAAKDTTAAACEDKDTNCEKWAPVKYRAQACAQNKPLMTEKCSKTCGFCTKK